MPDDMSTTVLPRDGLVVASEDGALAARVAADRAEERGARTAVWVGAPDEPALSEFLRELQRASTGTAAP